MVDKATKHKVQGAAVQPRSFDCENADDSRTTVQHNNQVSQSTRKRRVDDFKFSLTTPSCAHAFGNFSPSIRYTH